MKSKRLLLGVFVVMVIALAIRWVNLEPMIATEAEGAQVEGHFTDPTSRKYYDFERMKNPQTGLIPEEIRGKELAFAQKLPVKAEKAVDSWVAMGPNNKGGRTRALALDVLDENIIQAGGVTGGMWRSTDAGQQWTKTTDPQFIHSVSTVVQDKRAGNENVWYYGTGEEFYGVVSGTSFTSVMSGDGMFKSTDGGQSWTQLVATASNTPQNVQQNGSYDFIWNIVVDESNTEEDVVLAAVYNGIIRSTDGGETWTEVLGFGSPGSIYVDLHRTPNGAMYATFSSEGSISEAWRSTDGINWTDISIPQMVNVRRTVMDHDPANPNEVYFLWEGATGQNDIGHALFKYTYLDGDGSGEGGTWEDRSGGLPQEPCVLNLGANFDFGTFGSQFSYDLTIRHHPTQDEVIYIGGRNIFRSTDGFQSANNTDWIGGYRCNTENPRDYSYPNHHSDQHLFVFKPSNPDHMYNANDGGVYLTEDALADSVDWIPLNNGYLTTQFYTVAMEQGLATSDIIMGGMQDNGTWRTISDQPNDDWAEVHNDDGSYCAIPEGADFYIASSQNGRIWKKQLDNDGTVLAQKRIDVDVNIGYSFINPFIIDPTTSNSIYIAGNRTVWELDSLAEIEIDGEMIEQYPEVHWEEHEEAELPASAGRITALELSKSNTTVLYFGSSKSRLYKTINFNSDSEERVELNDDLFPSNAWTSSISANPLNADELLVSFSNYGIQSLFHSTDAGDNFVNVSGNLEENEDGSGSGPAVYWAEIYPSDPQLYIVGTSVGVFSTSTLDGVNTVWEQESPDLIGNVVVNMIETRPWDGKVAVATHGNGVYTGSLSPVPSIGVEEQIQSVSVKAYPNPFSSEVSFVWPETTSKPLRLVVFDAAGKIVHQGGGDAKTYVWTPEAGLSNGMYTYTLMSGSSKAQGSIVLQR